MAACGSLKHVFEKPLPEKSSLLESLSPWKHIKSMKPINDSSFTEIFGELPFEGNLNHLDAPPETSPFFPSIPTPRSSPSSSQPSNSSFQADVNPPQPRIDIHRIDSNGSPNIHSPSAQKKQYRHSDSFSSMNSESLSLCTEGLGFESFDDVEDLSKNDIRNKEWQRQEQRQSFRRNTHTDYHWTESKGSRTSSGAFPPPISCIGRNGKPLVCFKSYRQDGRFILKEMRIPSLEFLQACRENGRLKLQFVQSDDEILEQDEEEDADGESTGQQNEDIGNSNDEGDDKQDPRRNEQRGRHVETT